VTEPTGKHAWRKAVSEQRFPVGMRPVKATLLALPMTPDGRIVVWRDALVELVGLPDRTLNRHLARAVKAGWLVRDVRGGNGRRSVYTAAIPDELSAINGAQLGKLSATGSYTTRGSCLPRGGALNRKIPSASVSEHVALDRNRERRDDHDGTRDHHQRDERRSDEGAPRDVSGLPVSRSDSDSLSIDRQVDPRGVGARSPHVPEPSPAGTGADARVTGDTLPKWRRQSTRNRQIALDREAKRKQRPPDGEPPAEAAS
jgi:hypothetical protein